MTNWVKKYDIDNLITDLEDRLGIDWFRSPYTQLDDALDPDDPDMKTIKKFREHTKAIHHGGKRRGSGGHKKRLDMNRENIKRQLKAGWSQEKIAKANSVSRFTMSNYMQSDPELHYILHTRGGLTPEKIAEIVKLYKQHESVNQIAEKVDITKKTVKRCILNYEKGILSGEII